VIDFKLKIAEILPLEKKKKPFKAKMACLPKLSCTEGMDGSDHWSQMLQIAPLKKVCPQVLKIEIKTR